MSNCNHATGAASLLREREREREKKKVSGNQLKEKMWKEMLTVERAFFGQKLLKDKF